MSDMFRELALPYTSKIKNHTDEQRCSIVRRIQVIETDGPCLNTESSSY